VCREDREEEPGGGVDRVAGVGVDGRVPVAEEHRNVLGRSSPVIVPDAVASGEATGVGHQGMR
jgi:hypothetical protein